MKSSLLKKKSKLEQYSTTDQAVCQGRFFAAPDVKLLVQKNRESAGFPFQNLWKPNSALEPPSHCTKNNGSDVSHWRVQLFGGKHHTVPLFEDATFRLPLRVRSQPEDRVEAPI
jgi:hypothetical protein